MQTQFTCAKLPLALSLPTPKPSIHLPFSYFPAPWFCPQPSVNQFPPIIITRKIRIKRLNSSTQRGSPQTATTSPTHHTKHKNSSGKTWGGETKRKGKGEQLRVAEICVSPSRNTWEEGRFVVLWWVGVVFLISWFFVFSCCGSVYCKEYFLICYCFKVSVCFIVVWLIDWLERYESGEGEE